MWANKMKMSEWQFKLLMKMIDAKIELAIQTEIGGEVDEIIKKCDSVKQALKDALVD